MVELPHYLCFFFLFSLLTTRVDNCSICLLFVKLDILSIPKALGLACLPDPRRLPEFVLAARLKRLGMIWFQTYIIWA